MNVVETEGVHVGETEESVSAMHDDYCWRDKNYLMLLITDGHAPPGVPDLHAVSSMQHIEAMKERVKQMEAEAAKLREMQASVESQITEAQAEGDVRRAVLVQGEGKEVIDARSVFVGNVDYGATPEEIQAHFQSCGTINRVTILCDKWTGHPKGYAYVEFADASFVSNALFLSDSLFRGRLIKVWVIAWTFL
ncbi:MAG: hypothetical protein BJ554DRAFT_6805 [Olpidium bornovanus]|uniref:RRM domain-containing protein n=1 Tax=Olpidium bornovanus TaxID=278681 RepID=A0A8H8DJY1_9FUNG|nr:MAG: hypothetical protein BJ554DRAFT_6805 [Olpidium bornovanus]